MVRPTNDTIRETAEHKSCSKCGIVKAYNEFYAHHRSSDGYRWDCKSCHKLAEQIRNSTVEGQRTKKNRQLQRDYGITIEQYEIMLEIADHCCQSCGMHTNNGDKSLSVDHCHRTGRVRGLLCNSCNLALGSLEENLDKVFGLIKYIKNYV